MAPSLLWDHFVRAEGGSASCKMCLRNLKTKSGNTTSLRKHLKAAHNEQFQAVLKSEEERKRKKEEEDNSKKRKRTEEDEPKNKQPKLTELSDRFVKYSASSEKQKQFDQAMVAFLADTFVSFNVTGQDTFKKLFDIADKKLTVKHPTTYSRMVMDTAKTTLNQVCGIIAREKAHIPSVGITSDLWTSRGGDSYISLTLSWIDPKWRMQRFTPFVHPFPGRHTGVRISLELDDMMDDLNFDMNTDKVCVSDNASNMKVAMAQSYHLRDYFCDIHTLQLGIGDTFKNTEGMLTVLNKGKKIAKFCHQSTTAMEQLRASALRNNIAFRKPQNPGKTRWDSQLDNMKSVLHLKAAIEDLESREPEWEDKALSRSEWKLLEGAVKLLEPFKETTKVWQYESIPTINLVVDRIYCMEEELLEFIANRNNDKFGITFAKELKRNLEKRFPNHGLNVFERRAGNYLDPHFKGIHLRKFKKFDSTKDEIENRINAAQDDAIDEGVERNNNIQGNNSQENMSPTAKLRLEFEGLEPNEREVSKVRAEMALFDKLEISPKEANVLSWWKDHEQTLPNLAQFARKVLAIPVSSGKSERVFSTGGNFVTAKRTRLNAQKVQALIVIKENRKQIQKYLRNLGIDEISTEDITENRAFEQIRVVQQVFVGENESDTEPSSDDEYFMDED